MQVSQKAKTAKQLNEKEEWVVVPPKEGER